MSWDSLAGENGGTEPIIKKKERKEKKKQLKHKHNKCQTKCVCAVWKCMKINSTNVILICYLLYLHECGKHNTLCSRFQLNDKLLWNVSSKWSLQLLFDWLLLIVDYNISYAYFMSFVQKSPNGYGRRTVTTIRSTKRHY